MPSSRFLTLKSYSIELYFKFCFISVNLRLRLFLRTLRQDAFMSVFCFGKLLAVFFFVFFDIQQFARRLLGILPGNLNLFRLLSKFSGLWFRKSFFDFCKARAIFVSFRPFWRTMGQLFAFTETLLGCDTFWG